MNRPHLNMATISHWLIAIALLCLTPLGRAQYVLPYTDLDLNTLPASEINLPIPADPAFNPVLPGDDIVGLMSGNVDVQSGAASYTLPITVPPGIAGMEPQLAISYSSGGGNGLLGVGASVSGLSAIGRCAKTIRQDGVVQGVSYTSADVFCLDGQRLMRVSGSETGNSEFRTEVDNFSKIQSYNVTNGGPTYFKVWTKDGKIVEYGNTADSRVELGNSAPNSASSTNAVGLWAINKISDTVGNSIVFTYNENTATGEQSPSTISYAGNSVNFVYETRQDSRSGYVAGRISANTQRLQSINVKTGGTLVRSYTPSYSGANHYYPTRLLGLTECNGQGQCLPTNTFEWSDIAKPRMAWQEIIEPSVFHADPRYTFTGDFDGDGLTDYVSSVSATDIHIKLGMGNRMRSAVWRITNDTGSPTAWGHADYTWSSDFNGDGLADIASMINKEIHMFLSTGSGFKYENWKIKYPAPYQASDYPVIWGQKDWTWLADFTGDGRPDIASAIGNKVYVRINTGSSFEYEEWTTTNAWGTAGHNWLSDFNGDGYMDIASRRWGDMHMHLGTGNGFTHEVWTAGGSWGLTEWAVQGDFNGDGLSDIGYPDHATFKVYLGTGRGFKYEVWSTTGSWGTWEWQTATDLNGDGRTDIFSMLNNTLYMHISKGDGTMEYKTATKQFALGDYRYKKYVDMNGDGLVDILAPQAGKYYVGFIKHAGQPVVETFNNGLVDTKIEYTRATGHPEVYEKTAKPVHLLNNGDMANSPYLPKNPSVFPIQDVIAPMKLVSSLTMQTGENTTNKTYYRYGGMKADAHGRGSLGFAWTSVIDDQTGIEGYTEYHQSWPHASTPKYSRQTFNGVNLQESTATVAQRNTHNSAIVYPYVSHSLETKRDESGAIQGVTETTQSNIDAYGNVGTMQVKNSLNGAEYIKTTTSQYSNNITKWYIGRLLNSTVVSEAPGVPNISRKSAFTYYDSTHGMLKTEVVEPDSSTLKHTSTYYYDSYGNKTSVSVQGKNRTGANLPLRSSSSSYSYYQGKFPRTSYNALGHSETKTYDHRFGTVTKLTGPNGLSTDWAYDGFGRKTLETRADGNTTVITRLWAANCPGVDPRTTWCETTQSSGSSPITVHYDGFGRKIRQVSTGFDGTLVYTDSYYDHRGRISKVSRPYYANDFPTFATKHYDILGRETAVTEPGPNWVERTTSTYYNGLNVSVTNAKGHTQTTTYNVIGKVASVTDAANGSVQYQYDAIGNLIKTTDPAGNQITMTYDINGRKTGMNDPDMGVWQYQYNTFGELEWQKDAKNQTVTNSYDKLGRITQRVEPEGTSNWVYDTATKGKGKLNYVEDADGYKEQVQYDVFGRVQNTLTTIPGQALMNSSVAYDSYGRAYKETRPNGLQIYKHFNSQGYLSAVGSLKSQIHSGGDYDYSHLQSLLNQLLSLINSNVQNASSYYSVLSQYETQAQNYRIAAANAINDAELAQSLQSAADTLTDIAAQMQTEADKHAAKALDLAIQVQAHTTQTCINYYGVYCYDVINNIGLSLQDLQAAQQAIADHKALLAAGYIELANSLNASGAQTNANQSANTAANYLAQAQTQYNQLQNQADIYNPEQAARIQQQYNAMLQDSTYIYYWRAGEYDASGRAIETLYGNGLVNTYGYDQGSGYLNTIKTGLFWQDIRDLEYSYDALDNVLTKNDVMNGVSESYSYDNLDRLTSSLINVNNGQQSLNQTTNYSYDAVGNITNKSNVGAYYYASSRPHAVTQAGGTNYGYDANGNMTSGDGRNWQWTSFNKPKQITKAGNTVNFSYGPSRARYKQVATATAGTTTTYYIGSAYEKVIDPAGKVRHKNTISAGGHSIATITEETKNIAGSHVVTYTTHYLHQDALNSVDLITNSQAEVVSHQNFRPFGERRAQIYAAGFNAGNTSAINSVLQHINRGFGGHEELASVGLIHMNGRVYDAKLGRFASADPHIQAPNNSQSYNRYSYVLNNPLKYTDPSGFFFKKILKGLGFKHLKKLLKNKTFAMVASIAAAVLLGPGGAWAISGIGTIGQAAVAGFVSGYIGSGGNLKAAVIGGLTGAAFNKLHALKGGDILSKAGMKKIAAHGLVGGTSSVANGGKFGAGFLSAGFTQAVSLGGGFKAMGVIENAKGTLQRAHNAIAAAIVGGTASVIGGGKFENGARTGAMSRLFNDLGGEQKSSLNLFKKDSLQDMGIDRPDVDSPDEFEVFAHGDKDTVFDDRQGTKIPLTPEQLAEQIKNSEGYTPGMTIRLCSCNTGVSTDNFAQDLANVLQTNVIAPNNYYHPAHYSLNTQVRGRFGFPKGEWITFTPNASPVN